MTNKNLLQAMGSIDPKLIADAAPDVLRKKSVNKIWLKWGAAAACLGIIAMGVMLWRQSAPTPNEDPGITVSENGVTIPQKNVSLSANVAADMVAFFIYQGRCYVQYRWVYDNADLVGEYLGTAIGLINEWTPKEGYVELAGSVSGDFYAVNGYDPSFMLCMKDETGAVIAYICDNGITLKYGSELYEDRMHLSDNFESVKYESNDSWYYSKGEYYQLNNSNDMILDFIAEIDRGQFVPYNFVPAGEGQSTVTDAKVLYHLYLRMKDGMTVHLRLYENGYVRFDGMWAVCVQVPEESFSELMNLLENHIDSTV